MIDNTLINSIEFNPLPTQVRGFLIMAYSPYLDCRVKVVYLLKKQMANEITIINGVSKRREGSSNTYTYAFPKRTIRANGDTYTYTLDGGNEQTEPIPYASITDPLGSTDIISYCDALATGGYFFDGAVSSLESRLLDSTIIVKEASQLAGVLDSEKIYYIDDGVDMGTQQITVPAGGLYIRGVSNNIGGLSSTEPNYDMFIGGGNLFLDRINLETSGANSKIFNLTDPTGFNAVECTTVNFSNCTSLGTLTDYRQGLWQNVGLFDCASGLTLDGTWIGGFAIFTTIVRSFDVGNTGGIVLQATPTATIASRIVSDANIQVNLTSIAYKFIEANFTNDQTFQLKGGILSGTGIYVSGITVQSTKALWSSTGIPASIPGGKMDFTVEATTPIALANTPVKVAGTTVESDNIWMTQQANNRISWDSVVDEDLEIVGVISARSGNNNQIAFELHIYNDLNVLQQTLLFPPITTSGAGRAENVTILETFNISKDWYIELWVENRSGTTDITVEVNSRYVTKQIKAV